MRSTSIFSGFFTYRYGLTGVTLNILRRCRSWRLNCLSAAANSGKAHTQHHSSYVLGVVGALLKCRSVSDRTQTGSDTHWKIPVHVRIRRTHRPTAACRSLFDDTERLRIRGLRYSNRGRQTTFNGICLRKRIVDGIANHRRWSFSCHSNIVAQD